MYSAAILAGGRATRFDGRDKGALVVEGESIRARQLTTLSQVTDDLLIVGSVDGQAGSARAVADIVPDCGPMGGLHAALTHAAHDVVFVVACDMPYVTAPLAAHLLGLTADVDAVVPRTERGYHPVCAVYTRSCLPAVERRLAARQLKMLGLLDEWRVRVVSSEEIERFGDRHRLLANVNTPADYAGLEALHGHKR